MDHPFDPYSVGIYLKMNYSIFLMASFITSTRISNKSSFSPWWGSRNENTLKKHTQPNFLLPKHRVIVWAKETKGGALLNSLSICPTTNSQLTSYMY